MSRIALLILVSAAVAIGPAPGAQASAGSFTLQEATVFGTTHNPVSGSFTASGIDGCLSGTFADHLVGFSATGANLIIDRSYTCSDGNTLSAQLVLHVSAVDGNGQQASTGSWTLQSATGSLEGLRGAGQINGVASGCAPVGAIFAECQTGVDTVSGYLG